jgi:TonB family protein
LIHTSVRSAVGAAWLVVAVACGGGSAQRPVAPGAEPAALYETPAEPTASIAVSPVEAAGDPAISASGYLAALQPELGERWASFLDTCRQHLASTHPFNDERLMVTLALAIERSGALRSASVATTSGNAEFDGVAVEIARDAAPFAAPPPGIASDDGLVHVAWAFARDARQAGLGGARIDRVEWPLERAVPMLLDSGRTGEAAARIERAARAPDAPGADGGAQLVALADRLAAHAITTALAAGDVPTQRAGVEAAAAARLAAAAPALRTLAQSGVDLELRRAAIAALAAIGDKDAVPVLVSILQSEQGRAVDGQPAAAARALAQLGAADAAWNAVQPRLASGDEAVRWSALAVLSEFPAPAAVPQLVGLVTAGGQRPVRLAAASALGAVLPAGGEPARVAARALQARLADPDGAVRAAAAHALAAGARRGFRGRGAYFEVVPLIKDRDERVRAGATLASAALGGAKFSTELYLLRKENSAVVLQALAEALAEVPGEAALARLIELSRRPEPPIRRAAAAALASRTEPEARAQVASWVSHDDAELRLLAVGSLADAAALRPLLRSDDPAVQAAALARLTGTSGKPGLLVDMTQLMERAASPAERAAIARAWLGAPRAG